MKKIIVAIIVSCFMSLGVQAQEEINLETCSSYYDGCNTCTVFDGKLGACTEMYCFQQGTPKCLKEIDEPKKIMNAQDLCETYGGEYDNENCVFSEKKINASNLYSLYRHFTGQMMYMGGSRYFNERMGGNNFTLMQSDYSVYVFIKKNISKLYTQYQEKIDTEVKNLASKLNINTSLQDTYEPLLGKKNIERINLIANKLVVRTSGMTHIEKERFLIKKVQLLEILRNKYADKNTNGKYETILNILDYLYQAIEKNIAYE